MILFTQKPEMHCKSEIAELLTPSSKIHFMSFRTKMHNFSNWIPWMLTFDEIVGVFIDLHSVTLIVDFTFEVWKGLFS